MIGSPFLLMQKLDPLTLDYISRAGITNLTEIQAVNTFALGVRANSNVFNALTGSNSIVWLMSPTSFGAAVNNFSNSNFTLNGGVSPSFSQTGLLFNGTNQYLKSGYNPSVNMTLNNTFQLVSCRTNSQKNGFIFGCSDATGANQWGTTLRNTSDKAVFNCYNSATSINGANTNSSGVYVFNVLSSTNRSIKRNKSVLVNDLTADGGGLVNLEMYVGCRNLNGTASNFVPYELTTIIQGTTGLTSPDTDYLTDLVNNYNATVIQGGR